MTLLIGQMLGCLIVAAGIGGAVGWLLRHLSAGPVAQQLTEAETQRHLKDQELEKLQYELDGHISAIQILESNLLASDRLCQSHQQDLALHHDHIRALQEELAASNQRVAALASEQAALLSRVRDHETATLAQAEETRQFKAGLDAAQQALALKTEELAPLREHIAILEQRPADTERLRARIQELEPAQGRVHWLEVQLSERDTQHRTALHEVERQLAERDRRIGELEQLHQQLREHATAAMAPSQNIRTEAAECHTERTVHEQRLQEKDDHIAALQQRIEAFESVQQELAGQAKVADEKEEEISRLRKRLFEVRAALRIRTDGGVAPHPIQPIGDQLSLQIAQATPPPSPQKDDLTEIRGIGPAFERALNNMGIVTFQQIAQWDATNLKQIADKLETLPDRITRDQWIARAKKLHEQKYGKEL